MNVLRLYTARSSDEFDIGIFNSGDYIAAVQHKINTEAISKILYPSDSVDRGRELRSDCRSTSSSPAPCATSSSAICKTHDSFDDFAAKVAIQMNDTHPALTVAELMRLFIDDYGLPWEQAWAITVATCGYTNHTLMPEALEKWPFDLIERAAAAPSADHAGDQSASAGRGRAALSGRRGACCSAFRFSTKASAATCGWATWRWPAAIRSTAWPRCTRSS